MTSLRNCFVITSILIASIVFYTDSYSNISKQRKQEIADFLYQIELSGGDHFGYSSEILQHLEKSDRIKPKGYKSDPFEDVDRLNTRTPEIDIYSIFAGRHEIRGSLQLESIRPSDEDMRDIDPSTLKGIDRCNSPFDRMLKGDVKLYPVDRLVPDDFYYIHFTSGTRGFGLLNSFNDIISAVMRRFNSPSIDYSVRERFFTQLALRDDPELPSTVAELTITGSDPYIIEGSDITVIIRPTDGKRCRDSISYMRRFIKERYSAKENTITVSGLSLNHLYTDNRRVWSFLLTLADGTMIISNSVRAAERVISTLQGRSGSLADAPDYKYIRSIYPAGNNSEDGFIYLSEKFICRLISPQMKIAEARRVYEAMKIAVLEKYMIYYFQLTGKMPKSIEDVMDITGGPSLTDPRKKELDSLKKNPLYAQALKLDRDKLSSWDIFKSSLSSSASKTKSKSKKRKKSGSGRDDFVYDLKMFYKKVTGEQAYTPADVLSIIGAVSKPGGLDSTRFRNISIVPDTFSAKSEIYGRINNMIPLIELDTGKVSRHESEKYRQFAESFNSSFQTYPIAVRIKSDNGLSVETCIPPIKNSSLYALIAGVTGGQAIDLHPDSKIKGETLSGAFKTTPVGINTMLTLIGFNNGIVSGMKPEDIFTGEIQLHVGDSLPLADFDISLLPEIFSGGMIRSSEVLTGFIAWAFFHPVRIALPVKKSGDAMKIAGAVLDRIIEQSSLNTFVQNESYLYSYNNTVVRVVKLTLFGSLSARVYIAEKNGTLHLSTTEKYMKEIIDYRHQKSEPSSRKNAVIVYRPSEMVLERDIYRSAMLEKGLDKSRRNIGTMRLLGSIFPDADSRELPNLSFGSFGFRPVCPLGGDYILNRKSGTVRNSIYGSADLPVLTLNEKSSGTVQYFLKQLFSLYELRIEFEHASDGIRTKIQVR